MELGTRVLSRASQVVGCRGLNRWWIWALVAGSLVALAPAAEAGYRGPFEGRVVDAETRQPIQGAVVFMEWNLGHGTVAGRIETFYDAAEVLTDERGYFRIKKKWSWNPWTNWMLQATGLIYKAGYGAATNLGGTSSLRNRAASQKARSPEERQKMGPSFYFDIEFEDSRPVFLLKKLSTEEERRRNLPLIGVPDNNKMKLLEGEEDRERKLLGLN